MIGQQVDSEARASQKLVLSANLRLGPALEIGGTRPELRAALAPWFGLKALIEELHLPSERCLSCHHH